MGEFANQFRHENLSPKFLDNITRDKSGHTLKEIIEDEVWGWGVKLDRVRRMLKVEKDFFDKKGIKDKILSSIMDGPIDIDKLDYLLRDSQNCYLKYGELIDLDRLIRSLTVILARDKSGQINVSIGTYEKGQTAAESLGFARYLLYQSVYWHHTARAIRAMLRTAAEPALAKIKKGKAKYHTLYEEFEVLLGVTEEPGKIIINDVLDLIENWTDEPGKVITKMIKLRSYYKRILTVRNEPDKSVEKGRETFLDRFRAVHRKPSFQDELQKAIIEKFKVFLAHNSYSKTSLLAADRTEKTQEILSMPQIIICDCPKPVYGTDDALRFIPEPQRTHRNYFTRSGIGQRVSEVWNEIYFELMKIAAKGRVFCHPDIRDTLMAALSPEEIQECLEKVIVAYE